jgi:hypothetical protein
MELRGVIQVSGAKRPGLEIMIPEQADKPDFLTLRLKGVLTPEVADIIGCAWVYRDGTPQDGFKEMTLDVVFVDFELKLSGESGELDTYYPEKAYQWRVYHKGETKLGVQCKIDMNGNFEPIIDFFRKNRADGFSWFIKSRQGELFEGGTRVAMSDGTNQGNDPIGDVIDTVLNGIAEATAAVPEDAPDAAAPETPGEPPLAPRPRRKPKEVHGVSIDQYTSAFEPPAPKPEGEEPQPE